MNKTFTVSATSGTVNVEAGTKAEALARVDGAYAANGPRFTDSLRTKPRKRLNSAALGQVHYLGTREAVRSLARL